jgi:predicted MFS family arabinose efflux permease
MLSKWAPPEERNTLTSLAYAGMSLGTVISLPFSGLLAGALGWEWVFYVQGGLSAIWCIVWIFMVYDSPHEHPRIHPKEKQLFDSVMPQNGGQKREVITWFSLLTKFSVKEKCCVMF